MKKVLNGIISKCCRAPVVKATKRFYCTKCSRVIGTEGKDYFGGIVQLGRCEEIVGREFLPEDVHCEIPKAVEHSEHYLEFHLGDKIMYLVWKNKL